MRAIEDLQRDTSADDVDAIGVGGALWLVSAVAAVRNNDPWTARDRLRDQALPAARQLFDDAAQILGYDLADTCANGPAEKLNSTVVSQPARLSMLAGSDRLRHCRECAPR